MSESLFVLDDRIIFPPIEQAQEYPNGLLAVGGDLSVERLTQAYKQGIFPWFSEDEPLMWWSPDPRCVFNLTASEPVHLSKSLVRNLKKNNYRVMINRNFKEVIANCALPRAKEKETWITEEMQQAYFRLHQVGIAHSIEVYNSDDTLVGGLYGISIGPFFFGESMFSSQTDASKIALAHLSHHLKSHDFIMIDCQVPNDHLYSLGAVNIDRAHFKELLENFINAPQPNGLFTPNKTLTSWC